MEKLSKNVVFVPHLNVKLYFKACNFYFCIFSLVHQVKNNVGRYPNIFLRKDIYYYISIMDMADLDNFIKMDLLFVLISLIL